MAGFFLVPAATFAAGCVFLNLSGLRSEDEDEEGKAETRVTARRIGIISDTHGLLRQEVVEILKTCDCIFHAGDIGTEEILEQLHSMGKLFVVRGNGDAASWAEGLEESMKLRVGERCVFITHEEKDVPKDLGGIDVVIFGHSHKYFCETKEGILWLNPGGCGRKRFRLPVTMAVLELGQDGMRVKKYNLDKG